MVIKWEQIDSDDYKAVLENGDMLRVEEMGDGIWWWCAWQGEKSIDSSQDEFGVSAEDAKTKCIRAYKKLNNATL